MHGARRCAEEVAAVVGGVAAARAGGRADVRGGAGGFEVVAVTIGVGERNEEIVGFEGILRDSSIAGALK